MAFSASGADDADALAVEVLAAAMERVVAGNELRDVGVNPSPADIEHYLAMTERERRAAHMRWAVLKASGLFGTPT